jgi:hypothetical protein
LRKVCNHPWLIKGCEETDTQGTPQDEYSNKLVAASGKFVVLDKLLLKLKADGMSALRDKLAMWLVFFLTKCQFFGCIPVGHKVLIFSQMVKILDLLETYFHYRGFLYERLDGSVRGNDRQSAIDRFSKPDSDRFAFLLCTRAGGVGINLTAADTVIIFDSDWNPQNDIQAQARCHRIGQTQEVRAYRLITARTYERHMFQRASKKLGLDQAVLSNMGAASDPDKILDDKEIDSLLKHGAYDFFRDGGDDAGGEADTSAMSIEDILEHSTKLVWTSDGAQSSAASAPSAAAVKVDFASSSFWDDILPEETNTKYLVRMASNPATLSTNKEERTKFVALLEETVQEVLRGWQEGGGVRPKEMDTVIDVLRQCRTLGDKSEVFTAAENEQLAVWLEDVAHPKRKRKQVVRSRPSPFDEPTSASVTRDADADDLDDSSEKAWARSERIVFHETWLNCPDSRWSRVKTEGRFKDKTVEELYFYARAFLKACQSFTDCEDDQGVLQDYADSLIPPSADDIADDSAASNDALQTIITTPTFTDPTYKKIMAKRVKLWARRLKMFVSIRTLLTEDADAEEAAAHPDAEQEPLLVQSAERIAEKSAKMKKNWQLRPLALWWTRQDDVSLLLGVVKYGIGNYELMKRDSTLSFSQHGDLITANANVKVEASAEAPTGGTRADFDDEGDDDVMDIDYKPSSYKPAGSKGATPLPQFPDEIVTVLSVSTNAATATDASRLKLNFRVRHNRFHLSNEWPDQRLLDAHVKWLIDQIDRTRRSFDVESRRRRAAAAAETRKARAAANATSTTASSAVSVVAESKKREKLREWTKREEKELRNAVAMFGGGYWDVLKISAGLENKSEDQVKEYFFNLMALCRKQAVSGRGGSSSMLFNSPNAAPGTPTSAGTAEDHDDDSMSVDEPVSKKGIRSGDDDGDDQVQSQDSPVRYLAHCIQKLPSVLNFDAHLVLL